MKAKVRDKNVWLALLPPSRRARRRYAKSRQDSKYTNYFLVLLLAHVRYNDDYGHKLAVPHAARH